MPSGNIYQFCFLKKQKLLSTVLLKEIKKRKKVIRYINDDLKISSDDSDKRNSNKEDQKRKLSRKLFLSYKFV